MRNPILSHFTVATLFGFVYACGSTSPTDLFDDAQDAAPSTTGNESGVFSSQDSGSLDPGTLGSNGSGDVEAVVTTDNAFSFGYGDSSKINVLIRGVPSNGPEIFDCPVGYGPEPYTVPAGQAPAGAYLYIIAWADEEFTQGTLAQFKRAGGTPIYSGDGNWEACATGEFFDGDGDGPDQSRVNLGIEACNTGGAGTFSRGWVNTSGAITAGAVGKLAYGEANDSASGDFPIVCQRDAQGRQGIDAVARWMWFDPQDGTTPFRGNDKNRTRTFLIFRLSAKSLPPPVK